MFYLVKLKLLENVIALYLVCLLDIFTFPGGVKTTFLAAASKRKSNLCEMLH